MNWPKQGGEPDDEEKRRDYLKQQLQLKTMAKRNVLSADDMIESLLSKKEIFRKKSDTDMRNNKSAQSGGRGALFGGKVPPLYEEVWNYVKTDSGLADTGRVSTLLMTSGLTAHTLAYIWGLVNCTVAGSLTQQELYTTLALVSLAQNGYSFTNAAVVQRLSEAPVPRLETRLLMGGTYPSLVGSAPVATPASSGVVPTPSAVPSVVPTVAHTLGLAPLPMGPIHSLPIPTPVVAGSAVSSSSGGLSTLSATDLGSAALLTMPSPPSSSDPIFGDFQSSCLPQEVIKDQFVPTTSASSQPPLNYLSDEEFDDFKSADFTSVEPLPPPPSASSGSSSSSGMLSTVMAQVEDLFPIASTSSVIGPLEVESVNSTVQEDITVIPPSPGDLLDLCDQAVKKPADSKAAQPSEGSQPLSRSAVEKETNPPPVLPNESVVSEDKYSALRMLMEVDKQQDQELNISSDDFGDFVTAPESQSTFHQPTSVPFLADYQPNVPSIQVRCMEACVKVLQTALSTLQSVVDPDVLTEITSQPQGLNYLQDLVEVLRMCERLMSHNREDCGNVASSSDEDSVVKLHKDLKQVLLPSLRPYLTSVLHLHMEEEDGPMCGVCLCRVGPVHVKYGINNFHAPCANFYLHCVDTHLPIAPVAGAVSIMGEALKQQ